MRSDEYRGGWGLGHRASVARILPGETIRGDRIGGDAYGDLTDADSLGELARSVQRLDVLVVTAGVSPALADARTIFDVNLAGMARVLDVFDGLVVPGSVAICVASMADHLGVWPDAILQQLDVSRKRSPE